MLELSGIAKSTYYYYLKQKNKGKYESEKQDILEIYNTHKGRYGYRRICSELKAKGYPINHKTVLKLMKLLDLRGKQSKNGKYHSYKGEVGKVADNLLKRDFHADKPFEKLTTDITEFKIGNEKAYLSPVLDKHQHAEYQRLLAEHHITQSMSRKGNCTDNGIMESPRGFIEKLEEYIYYYNNERTSLKLKGMSPVQFRTHSNAI